jgi:glycosyltransferase involved in cell wall biosynthesis
MYTRGRLLLSFANLGPLILRRQCVTVHDASVFAVPDAYTAAFRTWYRRAIPTLGRQSRRILTDSHFSRQELNRLAGIRKEKITVVPLAADHMLAVEPDLGILERHGLIGRRFILAVGGGSRHKNLDAVLRALAWIESSVELVVVGGGNRQIFQTPSVAGGPGIRHVGYVTDAELRALYQAAACLVYPSLYEGFGLPPLEAMTCGCPVIVSRTASLPEVCGDAALYCDPLKSQDIAGRVREVLEDESLQTSLRQRGLERAQRFRWDASARTVLQVVEEVLGLRGGRSP